MKLFFACVCLAATSFAQPRPAVVGDSAHTNLPAHQIGPNDLLSVSVYDAPELSRMLRVSIDGFVRVPMLKSRVKVAGAMPVQVEAAIANALEEEEILVGPIVTVTVAEYSSRPVNITGAVRQPQTFQAIGTLRLLDAISKAGGLSDAAGSEILVSRTDGTIHRVAVKGLLESADPELNLPLAGGEEIRVMEAGKAFVVGNVKRPGAFPLRDSTDNSVLQMLALAEGLAPYSAKQAFIYRRDADGSRKEIPVELAQILLRKHADVAVMADDILYIPESKARKLSMAALEKVVLFGSNAGATALIYSRR